MEEMQKEKEEDLTIGQMTFISGYQKCKWLCLVNHFNQCCAFFNFIHHACIDLNSYCCLFQFLATYVDELASIGLSAPKEERRQTQLQHPK